MYRGTYKLVGSELSLFTRKLEAQLRYQGIPYTWRFKTMEDSKAIEQRAGTRFIPVLETPDGWFISDTIAIGPMLSQRFSTAPVVPGSPVLRSLCFVLEDYYNHWLARHVLHSRWCYDNSVADAGKNFGANMMLGKSISETLTPEEEQQVSQMGSFMRDSFGRNACEVQGAGPDQAGAIQADFAEMMSLLEEHFDQHSFLMGERACLADFALVGAAVAHFLQDPEPQSWLGSKQAMLESYVARVWSGQQPDHEWPEVDQWPTTLEPIMKHAQTNYQPFALAAIEAAAKGEKHFSLDLGHGEFTARAMKRLDKSRLHVQDEITTCGGDKSALAGTGILEFYLRPAIVS